MPEVTIPAEPDWWRARDRDGDLWVREPQEDGSNFWVIFRGALDAYEWKWPELVESWGPITCADGETVTP